MIAHLGERKVEERWRSWLLERNRRGLRGVLWIVITLYPLFGLLDYVIAPPDWLWLLYGTRAVVAAVTLVMFRVVRGSLFGDCNPTTDIPRLLGLYQNGNLKLDELVTRTYRLEEVNRGYDDLLEGANVRGVVVHEH